MNKVQKTTIILWIKRIFGFTAISLWIVIIYSIAESPVSFTEQASYCMLSTMMIFGLLSIGLKGLEYWEKKEG